MKKEDSLGRFFAGSPLVIPLIYALVAALWIAGSDHLLATLVRDPGRLTQLQTYKGWAFVAVTATLLFGLVYLSHRSFVVREARHRAMIDQSPVPVIEWSLNFRITEWNQAAERVFGYSKAQALGQPADLIVPDEAWAKVAPVWEGLQRGDGGQHSLNYNKTADGRIILCQWHNRSIRDAQGNVVAVVSSVEDVTEAHRLRCELKELNKHLEERVIERTRELKERNSALDKALNSLHLAQNELIQSEKMAALGGMVAGIAHELNTPIGNALVAASSVRDMTKNFIEGYKNGNLRRSAFEDFIDTNQEGNDLVMRNLFRASELIGSFKQIAVDQTSCLRRSFDLSEMVGELLITLGSSLRKEQVEVRTDIPSDIRLNSYPGPLGQVVINLINNALLHAFNAESVSRTITIDAHANSDSSIVIRIADNGVGIPDAHRSRIFDPFFTTRLGQGGSGLGLAIVHNLVSKALGGSIQLEQKETSGSRFVLTLPLVAPDSSEADPISISTEGRDRPMQGEGHDYTI